MRIVFFDDSIPFDGFSPASEALGGPEKALAGLAPALAQRGHTVEIFNRCTYPVTTEGAKWESWTGVRPVDADAVIACRMPRLLEENVTAPKRILWFTGDAAELDEPHARECLERTRPKIVFFAQAERDAWSNPLGLEVTVCAAGIMPAYLDGVAGEPQEPPLAIATAHPLAGLDWLLGLWLERIRPAVPHARLALYSNLLHRGRIGGVLSEAVRPVFDRVTAAAEQGVEIRRPAGDSEMALAYRSARVHLYPGQAKESWGATLMESQAAGLPGVGRSSSPAALMRILNGQTGAVCGNDDTFAAAAIEYLNDRVSYDRAAANARSLQGGRTWQIAAAEFEGLLQ
jgi:hypothetical protein